MQAHLFSLLRHLVAKHTDIRDVLARCTAGDIPAFENVLSMTERAVKDGLLDYEADPSKYESVSETELRYEKQEDMGESSVATVNACKRPWWVCQPYVRPLPREALEKGSLQLSKKEMRKLKEESASKDPMPQHSGQPEREKLDSVDGMSREEMPRESMVCG